MIYFIKIKFLNKNFRFELSENGNCFSLGAAWLSPAQSSPLTFYCYCIMITIIHNALYTYRLAPLQQPHQRECKWSNKHDTGIMLQFNATFTICLLFFFTILRKENYVWENVTFRKSFGFSQSASKERHHDLLPQAFRRYLL